MSLRYSLLLVAALVTAGCGDAPPSRSETAPASDGAAAQSAPPQVLEGGGWNLKGGSSKPGDPFELTVIQTEIEVVNHTQKEVVPACVLTYGSQVAVVDTDDEPMQPGEQVWVHGAATFPRPLDDYESSDALCYTRLPERLAAEIRRQHRKLSMGRRTTVPNLIGRRIDACLPSFRRGLDIEIRGETTPCSAGRLMKMSRSVYALTRRPCGNPIVIAQDPAPGVKAYVGDVIDVEVTPKS